MQADKIIGAPGVGLIDPGLQTGGVAGSQLLFRRIAGKPHVKIRIRPEQRRQAHSHLIIDILLSDPVQAVYKRQVLAGFRPLAIRS